MTRGVFFSILVGLILFCVNPSYSATINIPDDYPTIQAGINASVNGDTVLVAPGTYTENINFSGKAIVLLSSGGRDATSITSASSGTVVVTFSSSEDTTSILDGFTIDGLSTSRGVYCVGAGPIIKNCEIKFCVFNDDGPGIYCENSAAKIRYNLIHNNQTGVSATGGGICVKGSGEVEISYNSIYSNTNYGGPGIGCPGASNIKIAYNLIRDNFGGSPQSGGIYISGSNCEIINNTIIGNSKGVTILNGSGTVSYTHLTLPTN